MVKTKEGTHRSKLTQRAGVRWNGADLMVRTKPGSHGYEWIWCAGACRKEAGYIVRTQYPSTAKPNYKAVKFHNGYILKWPYNGCTWLEWLEIAGYAL